MSDYGEDYECVDKSSGVVILIAPKFVIADYLKDFGLDRKDFIIRKIKD